MFPKALVELNTKQKGNIHNYLKKTLQTVLCWSEQKVKNKYKSTLVIQARLKL